MQKTIPSANQVRIALADLTMRQIDRLSELSGVPPTTIYKIKLGATTNPGIDTVRKVLPHLAKASRALVRRHP